VITLIGTGHVFNLRARVQEEIFRRVPSVVCLELDPARYHALRSPDRGKGKAPLVYRMLANFQDRLAEGYGVKPGDEMLAASDAAKDLAASIALIDKDAQQTFQRLMKEMPFREKFRLVGSSVAGLFMPGKSVEDQVKELEQDYTSYFNVMGKKFPTLKRILIDERNEHMANALVQLHGSHQNVVAVLGDGHVDGILQILTAKGLPVETVRLKDLRTERPAVGTATTGFTVETS